MPGLRRAGRRSARRRGRRPRLHDPRRDQPASVPARHGRHGARLEATPAAVSSSSRYSPQPHLDGRYTVFGQVVDGMDVVDRLAVGDVVRRVRAWDGKTDAAQRACCTQKRGRHRTPPRFDGECGLPLLRRLFLSALGCFLRHARIPPSSGLVCASERSAPALGRCRLARRPALPDALRLCRSLPRCAGRSAT